jgi:EAL domain-containing protein (putative c-di-GMP-specific phosphodiesterase class I)
VYTTASIGVVVHDSSHKKAEAMLRDADIAMYYAKDRRLDWAVFDRSMRANAESRQKMETDLRYAIVCNELEVYYQPIVSLDTMRLYGFEALVRWNHPQNGLITPADFIPLSEDTGLVIPMTVQILKASCQQAIEWQQKYPQLRYLAMSVNLSGKHFSDSSLVGQIESILQETGIEPQCLKLEITESSTMEDAEKAIEKLREIKRLGVKLSIDDFGTGYSSLSYLRRFPLDTLKIDRSFVSAMDESTESDEIVNTIMALAKSLKLDVVAEGIENVEQLKHLRRLGCEYGQGYLFSCPLTVTGVEAMIAATPDWAELVDDSVFNSETSDNDYSQAEFTN